MIVENWLAIFLSLGYKFLSLKILRLPHFDLSHFIAAEACVKTSVKIVIIWARYLDSLIGSPHNHTLIMRLKVLVCFGNQQTQLCAKWHRNYGSWCLSTKMNLHGAAFVAQRG